MPSITIVVRRSLIRRIGLGSVVLGQSLISFFGGRVPVGKNVGVVIVVVSVVVVVSVISVRLVVGFVVVVNVVSVRLVVVKGGRFVRFDIRERSLSRREERDLRVINRVLEGGKLIVINGIVIGKGEGVIRIIGGRDVVKVVLGLVDGVIRSPFDN
jgi:hypothetical protein